MWIPIGAVPFLLDVPGAPAVGLVIAMLAVRGLFGPVWVTASTSWLRNLVPRQGLGSYHGRRLAAMTAAMAILAEPLRDRNFSQLVRFLFLWSLTSNLAIHFFAVFMLTRLGLSLPALIGLTVLSQLANVVFLKVWGPLADRVGSKTVLSLSASLFLLVILSWTFTTHPDRYFLTVPLW